MDPLLPYWKIPLGFHWRRHIQTFTSEIRSSTSKSVLGLSCSKVSFSDILQAAVGWRHTVLAEVCSLEDRVSLQSDLTLFWNGVMTGMSILPTLRVSTWGLVLAHHPFCYSLDSNIIQNSSSHWSHLGVLLSMHFPFMATLYLKYTV